MATLTPNGIFNFLGSAASGAFAMSQDQTILFWDSGAEQLLGYPAEQVVGLRCNEVPPAGLMPECGDGCLAVRLLREGFMPRAMECKMRCASGEGKWMSISPVVVGGILDGEAMLVYLLVNGAGSDGLGSHT